MSKATPEAPAPDKDEKPQVQTIDELALDIAFLTKKVAKEAGMPIGTALSVVRTTLDLHTTREGLALQRLSITGPFVPPGAKPVALPDDDTQEEE